MSFADARAVATRIGERAAAALGEPVYLREYPAAVDGDVGRVVLGVVRGAMYRALAAVADLAVTRTAVREAPATGGRLRGSPLRTAADEVAIADAIARAAADAAPWPLGVLDAGFGVLDVLGQRLAVPGGRWRLATWGEWGDRAGVSIDLAGGDHEWLDVVRVEPAADGGVAVRVPAGALLAPDRGFAWPAPGALVDAVGAVVDAVRAAIDGRAAFRARPGGLPAIAARLVAAIRADAAVPGPLRVRPTAAAFPYAWPAAVIERTDDAGAPWIELAEGPGGVTVTALTAHGPAAADAIALAPILAELRAAADRLRPDRLIPGRRYRALVAIELTDRPAVPRGATLVYQEREVIPRDGYSIYRFAPGDPGGPGLELVDDGPDAAVLRRLHAVLAPADPA